MADWLTEETGGFLAARESFWLLLYFSVILISSAGCCCSTDSHFPPHILTGPSSAWVEGWSACFPVPGDVQLHTALQVTASRFSFPCGLISCVSDVYVHWSDTPHSSSLPPLTCCFLPLVTLLGWRARVSGLIRLSVACFFVGHAKDHAWKVIRFYCLPSQKGRQILGKMQKEEVCGPASRLTIKKPRAYSLLWFTTGEKTKRQFDQSWVPG